MNPFSYLLYPISWLYGLGSQLRNHLYNINYSRTHSFTVPIIAVGNITAGGTGKSPMVEMLAKHFKSDFKPAILSRGYKRKTSGFRFVDETETAYTVGDEPFQFYRKFGNEVVVGVSEDRVMAIPLMIFEKSEVNLFILDDAFQQRRINADVVILLNHYNRPFYNDHLLPFGLLREKREEAKRAHILVVSNCPRNLAKSEQQAIVQEIKKYASPNCPVFFSTLAYDSPYPLNEDTEFTLGSDLILVSGIANSEPLKQHVESQYHLLAHFNFADHYAYRKSDIEAVKAAIPPQGASILITEKDAAKWYAPDLYELAKELPVFVLPVKPEFLGGDEEFFNSIHKLLNTRQ
jgi:tetraacyldisaccharide 4'-kinase